MQSILTTPENKRKNDFLLSVICNEPEGDIERSVYQMQWTPENIDLFYEKTKVHRTLFGREFSSPTELLNLFFYDRGDGQGVVANGLFWIVDDWEGLFYITNIDPGHDALVHYSFFSGRHKGREPLVRAMLCYLFDIFQFNRLTAELPLYVKATTRRFAENVGFKLEGKRRQAVKYRGDWFDVGLYGLLKEELNG